MEKPNEEKFDGQVVMLAIGDMDNCDARYYHHGKTMVEVYKTLNCAKNSLTVQQMELPPELARGIFPQLPSTIELLKSEYGEDIINTILNGRLKVSILLDSPGGMVASSDHRKNLIKMIQEREDAYGKAEAYLKYASGGAAEIFLQADERVIFPESIICPTFYTGEDEDFNEERNYHLSSSMVARAPKNVRSGLEERIDEILENEEGGNSMFFDSAEMMRYGMATKIVENISEMREEFLKRTGITLLPDNFSTEFEQGINRFFQ